MPPFSGAPRESLSFSHLGRCSTTSDGGWVLERTDWCQEALEQAGELMVFAGLASKMTLMNHKGFRKEVRLSVDIQVTLQYKDKHTVSSGLLHFLKRHTCPDRLNLCANSVTAPPRNFGQCLNPILIPNDLYRSLCDTNETHVLAFLFYFFMFHPVAIVPSDIIRIIV